MQRCLDQNLNLRGCDLLIATPNALPLHHRVWIKMCKKNSAVWSRKVSMHMGHTQESNISPTFLYMPGQFSQKINERSN